jgi:hypothetical protein
MTQHRDDQGPAMLDALIDAITVDANSNDEKTRPRAAGSWGATA